MRKQDIESVMMNDHYYKIYGWMKNVYKLRGNSLEVYAALYALTKKKSWTGTFTTLAGYLDIEITTLKRALKILENKGLLSIESIAYSTYVVQAMHGLRCTMHDEQCTMHDEQAVEQNAQAVEQNAQVVEQNAQDLKERTKENINKNINKKENNSVGAKLVFCPPRWEEVYEYSKSKLVPIDTAKSFYCYYEANGWRMSKGCRVMKWQALLMKWDIENHQRAKEQAVRAVTHYQQGNQLTSEQVAARRRQLESERLSREQADIAFEAEKNDAETQEEIDNIQERLAKKLRVK